MRILLQFPEGLKQKAIEYAKRYESKGHEVFISASPCYGACDLALDEARWLHAKKIVHFGHNRFIKKSKLPNSITVEYVPYPRDADLSLLANLLPYLKDYRRIALAATVQHIHQIKDVKRFFEKNGKKVLIGKPERAEKPGQVLGCDATAVTRVAGKVDAIVFVGDGMFHALAIEAIRSDERNTNATVDKPVLVFNPYSGSVKDIREDIAKLAKLRRGAITRAFGCKCFSILLSTKPGQFNLLAARWAKKELEKRGLVAEIVVANELDPMALGNFMAFDCYITTACPRIADDQERFGKPVLSIAMLKELLRLFSLTTR